MAAEDTRAGAGGVWTRRDAPNHTTQRAPSDVAPASHDEGTTGRAARRLTSLVEASRVLGESLDYETTLATVAHLATPELGAWCIVDLLEEDGTIRRLAVVHPDPAKQELARQLGDNYPPERDDIVGMPRVMRTGRSELVPEFDDTLLASMARSMEHLMILRELGIGSYIVVPLNARGNLLGSMTFVSARGSTRYTFEDLVFAEELAARAAMAVDNARLYRAAARERSAAERATLAKNEFLATMSHELRTPLNAIQGYVDLMHLGLSGPLNEAQRTQLTRVRQCGAHLTRLVDEVLDIARLEAGRAEFRREAAHMVDAVEGALAIVRMQAAGRDVRIESRCAEDVDAAYEGDPERVQQIVHDLLSNALKFTPAGGTVRITCGVAENGALPPALPHRGRWSFVRVSDTGIGIAPADSERIFESFVQLDSAKTRRHGGVGLGLAVGRRLARAMAGELTVESMPGHGSAFTLWLPYAPEAPSRRTQRSPGIGRLTSAQRDEVTRFGERLLASVSGILRDYLEALRADPPVPSAARLSEVQLLDHIGSMLADAAHALFAVADSAGEASELLRDAADIQRMIADRHGAQRQRLGWSEEALRREYRVLREIVFRALDAEGDGLGREMLRRLLAHAESESVHAHRVATAAMTLAVRSRA